MKNIILILLMFLIITVPVLAYDQPEVTGIMDFSNDYGNFTFHSYGLGRTADNNDPALFVVYTYTNTSDKANHASLAFTGRSVKQNGRDTNIRTTALTSSPEYQELCSNLSIDVNPGESIDFCCTVVLWNIFEPVEFRFGSNCYTKESPDGIIDLSQINDPTPYDLDLSAGHYTGGLGIPTGTYSINLVSGHGNVISRDGDINEIFGEGRTTYYNNFSFTPGIDLEIGGSLIVHIHCDAADFGAIKQREIVNEEEKILYPGKYGAGYDFPSGTYFIQAYEGHGNVHSSEADINEILSVTPEEGHSIYQYNYATFKDGDVLEISSCTVKLLPAGS